MSQIWHSSGLFPSPLSLLWCPVPFHFSALSGSEWQEELLQPDSYYVVWALAPTRLPRDHPVAPSQCLACGEETSRRWWLLREKKRGGEGKREGGRSLGAVYRDVVPPIVLSVWLSLMVRLFASPMPLMSLHQSCSQTFDPQFKAALVKICMLIARLPNSCLKSQIMLHQGRTSHPSNWDPVDSLCRDEMLVSSVGNPLIFMGSDELKRKSITFSKGCSSWMKVWLNSGRGPLPLT